MSEPDEAILWARERAARWQDEGGGLAGPSYRSGKLDDLLGEEVEAYRAGQAASAERIKALEEVLREGLTAVAAAYLQGTNEAIHNDRTDHKHDRIVVAWKAAVRALLKEADQ
ncbi:MAG: hypothetical protein INH43_20915 [Acidobacteriaceae bacterium]|nr:hypothetical protein [Acidobacteriaceae bacterium]